MPLRRLSEAMCVTRMVLIGCSSEAAHVEAPLVRFGWPQGSLKCLSMYD